MGKYANTEELVKHFKNKVVGWGYKTIHVDDVIDDILKAPGIDIVKCCECSCRNTSKCPIANSTDDFYCGCGRQN